MPSADASLEDDATATQTDASETAPQRVLPIDRIVVETPYRLYERPRAKGAVAAAVADEALARWNVGGKGDPAFISNRPGFHPGARVRVDTKVTRGRLPSHLVKTRRTGRYPNVLSETSLLARSRKYGYWPYRLCFEEGLRENPALSGKTTLRLTIDGRGRVVAPRVTATKLKDAEVPECLRKRTQELTFPPPPRGRSIGVDLTVELWPGDAPVSRIAPPRGEHFDNPGTLDATVLENRLRELVPQIAECYDGGLSADPDLWGRLAFRLDVAANGKLARSHEEETRFPDRGVRRCVQKLLNSFRPGAPRGGEVHMVAAFRLGAPPVPQEADRDAPADAGVQPDGGVDAAN
ncbi:MAG: AgmX/PglI C-terminal domain-containing protein [Polyangiaceae bacterium]